MQHRTDSGDRPNNVLVSTIVTSKALTNNDHCASDIERWTVRGAVERSGAQVRRRGVALHALRPRTPYVQ
jgi:hypothetical protein